MRLAHSYVAWIAVASAALAWQRPAVEWKDGEIWLMREGRPAVQLTSDGCEKGRLPVWAPDGKTVAYYRNQTLDKPTCPSEVVLLSTEGTQIGNIPALRDGNSVGRIEWLGDRRIGIDTHINPSLGQYRVVDVVSGKELAAYSGFGFSPSPDFKYIAHAGPVPHFSPPFAKSDYLMIDDRIIYPAVTGKEPNLRSPDTADPRLFRDIHEFRTDMVWSPEATRIAFIERIFDWRADESGSYRGIEENERWWLVAVPVAAGGAARIRLPGGGGGPMTVRWIDAARVRTAVGGLSSEYSVLQ